MNFLSNLNPIMSFAIGVGAGLSVRPFTTYMHELGHVFAVRLLFDNAEPKIELINYGYSSGLCRMGIKRARLSSLGCLVGPDRASAIISAAGPLVEIIISIALRCLIPHRLEIVGFCFCNNLLLTSYALSVFKHLKVLYKGKHDNSNSIIGHDFLSLRIEGGLLPAAALITASVGLSVFSFYDALFKLKRS